MAFAKTKVIKTTKGAPRPLASIKSLSSFSQNTPRTFIPAHGGYKKLLSYQKALVVFDATIYLFDRFVGKRDRTRDQMIQAARSGKQNIIKGSQASGTSKEMEIKLTNVARASLEELLEDYHDNMRNLGITEWAKEHPYARRL